MSRILYVQYTNPGGYPPLEHSSRILADAGWKVLFMGTGALGSDALVFPGHPNIQVKRLPFCSAGWRQKLHYIGFGLWVLGRAIVWRPRWVYASDPLSSPVALLLSYLPNCGVLYHEHDTPESAPSSRYERLVVWCRRTLARRATACILPNEGRAERFANQNNVSDVLCVWNCPRRDEAANGPRTQTADGLSVVYHGSVTPSRLPKSVLDAIAMFKENVTLRVIGYETVGHLGYIRELQEFAQLLGIAHRVEFLGVLKRSEVLTWCRKSDVGLAFIPSSNGGINFHHMVGASNKAFDCLASALPLLVSDLPDWRATFVESGYAVSCVPEEPSSIQSALEWFLRHPSERLAMGEKGRRRVMADWNYASQFAPVMKLITDELGNSTILKSSNVVNTL